MFTLERKTCREKKERKKKEKKKKARKKKKRERKERERLAARGRGREVCSQGRRWRIATVSHQGQPRTAAVTAVIGFAR